MGKEGFIAFLNKAKTSKYYITFNIRLSCIFSVFYKICLYYLCYERLFICTENGKRRKMVFRGIMSRNWLSELRKCASDGSFHPYRRGKKRGVKGRLKGQMITFYELY